MNKEINKPDEEDIKIAETIEGLIQERKKIEFLKNYYDFTEEQVKMYDLMSQLWHLTYLSNKKFGEVLKVILKQIENI